MPENETGLAQATTTDLETVEDIEITEHSIQIFAMANRVRQFMLEELEIDAITGMQVLIAAQATQIAYVADLTQVPMKAGIEDCSKMLANLSLYGKRMILDQKKRLAVEQGKLDEVKKTTGASTLAEMAERLKNS